MRASSVAKRWRQRPRKPRRGICWRPSAQADGADDQQPGAQRQQLRRLILHNLAFEVRDEVEQETDQAEGGFGAIEGVQGRSRQRQSRA